MTYLFVFVLLLGCGLASALGPKRDTRGANLERAVSDARESLNHVISKRDAMRAELKVLVLLVWWVAMVALLISLFDGFW
ncbi:hypothetical protein [Neorhizobium galegae]|uniref:Transmembrane protein n=2 Tax=Neorhizobium galegae TaxID=399 RepID=A0A068SUB4_NEOGA|nr:hypothetical protein [Neorhizobium galegae]KAB1088030.1 hypothetical protein F4V91_17290 [Neorhizobium galegae]MCQ1850612.1 hypothetical protein [Neorhizobium galegae]CDN49351.1 Hypothetical protein RG540_CH31870 [Neorhizobium galegae bv. orientalis str. HAMBI 540]CDZ47319.1 Hypothetical protein NGAL_HAMBI2427_21180 [Neorhizobium galegae bv. orientalis]